MSTLLDRIENLIKEKGVKPFQITTELGLASSTFSDWRKGKAKPSLDAVVKLSKYFNVSIDYLVFGEDLNEVDSLEFSNSLDAEVLTKFRSLTPELQNRAVSYIDGMIAASTTKGD